MTKDPKERLEICASCTWLTKPLNRCLKCGCFMNLKVKLEWA